jgi:hypothetical protein
MKTTFWISLLLISSIAFGQKLQIKKAELLLEVGTKTSDEIIQINSADLDVQYINNKPEINSEGEMLVGSLETEDVYIQELIKDNSSEKVEFDMIFKNNQFANRSNLEFAFKSVLKLTINNITEEIPVDVLVSNIKSNQTNFYLINVSGNFLMSKFELEISSLDDEVRFSYRQNVQVRN